jgi:hypothetical protein
MPTEVTYACPNCGNLCCQELTPQSTDFSCPTCSQSLQLTKGALVDGVVEKCAVCPSTELFVRKDFPQRVGVAIVTLGFAASCIAWYYHMLITTFAILFATALIDVALYVLVGDLLECYRCHAQYRGSGNLADHAAFDLEVHERHRQMQARLKSAVEQSPEASLHAKPPVKAKSPSKAKPSLKAEP